MRPRRDGLSIAGALWLLMSKGACVSAEHRSPERDGGAAAPIYQNLGVRIVTTYPHAVDAFTEGLLYQRGFLYESTGLEGMSSIRQVQVETGSIAQMVRLDAALFGEGLALVDSQLVQFTWRSGRVLVWDMEPLALVREHAFGGEAWGACYDGERLVVSDGTDVLRFFAPADMSALGAINVTKAGSAVDRLNELECVGTDVYANILGFRHIARIDGRTGRVTGWIDTGGLLRRADASTGGVEALNGIAYVPEREHFLLTGKLWPLVFEVELVAAP